MKTVALFGMSPYTTRNHHYSLILRLLRFLLVCFLRHIKLLIRTYNKELAGLIQLQKDLAVVITSVIDLKKVFKFLKQSLLTAHRLFKMLHIINRLNTTLYRRWESVVKRLNKWESRSQPFWN